MKGGLAIFGVAILAGVQLRVAPAQAELAKPNCADQTQIGLNRCAVDWSKATDRVRSRVYRDRLTQLSVQYRPAFVRAEKDWQDYRKAHCTQVIEPFQGGSMVPMVYHNCLATLNRDRIANLRSIDPPTNAGELETKELRQLLDTLHRQPDQTQQLWNRYQSAYCKFDAEWASGTNRITQCPMRLNTDRLRHLKEMMAIR